MAATRAEVWQAAIRQLERNVIADGFLQDHCRFAPNLSEPLNPTSSEEGEQLAYTGS